MSTKIYNGFRYSGQGGLAGCYHALNGIRDTMEEVALEKYRTFLAQNACDLIDRRALGLKTEDVSKSPVQYARSVWLHRVKENHDKKNDPSAYLDDSVNVDSMVHLFVVRRKIIGIFEGPREFHNVFTELPFIGDYSYWNNTDAPDDMCPREWSRRSADWEEAFPHRPSQRSMQMKLSCEYEPWILLSTQGVAATEAAMQSLPTMAERARRLVNHYMHSQGLLDDRDYKWLLSDEGGEVRDQTLAEMTLRLPNIDAAILSTK